MKPSLGRNWAKIIKPGSESRKGLQGGGLQLLPRGKGSWPGKSRRSRGRVKPDHALNEAVLQEVKKGEIVNGSRRSSRSKLRGRERRWCRKEPRETAPESEAEQK